MGKRVMFHMLLVVLSISIYNYVDLKDGSWSSIKTKDEASSDRKLKRQQERQLEVEKAILKKPTKVIGEACHEIGNCFEIMEQAHRRGGKLTIWRNMVLKDLPTYTNTVVQLINPQPLTWNNFNTKDWKVDKKIIVAKYIQTLVSASFFTEAVAFKPTTTEKQEILLIGLGGGVASNFFSQLHDQHIHTTSIEIDGEMATLASKYFGHEESDNTTVIIDDGVEYVKRASEENKKFKAVLVDASYSEGTGRVAPVDEFLVAKTIKHMSDITDDNGVLGMNIQTLLDHKSTEDAILEMYKPYFPSCSLVRSTEKGRTLICSKRPNWTFEEQRQRFLDNMEEIDKVFKFGLGPMIART